ncbi:lytic polysaccharide monooxygenase [Frankia sp. Mgl5]|uniref:lytic polysaccharide monooxygenase auxiliary activity family 9 protein n=1 Tax=Frankia sp. Mgl5 TaxID=2933793 RepID=UPI00200F7BFB|nr:lytic polysaccharide monooxygenase auxiliary activity family 9 protein [Frankia sp. Mgl5]MCK9930372.1 lytic polysaccharide monooxygenase [Frankia sp. Mgl5]
MTEVERGTRHGLITDPPCRSQILEAWQAAGLESGKFFPATEAGLRDPYAPDDISSNQPPADGKIASAGHDFASVLDDPSRNWAKNPVKAGQELTVTWHYHAAHKTRRWNYFITRDGWDPNAPLTRAQFEPEPFYRVENSGQPYWSADDLIPPDPTVHTFTLPTRRGYHAMLAVWEVADTGNAFYQVMDLSFS